MLDIEFMNMEMFSKNIYVYIFSILRKQEHSWSNNISLT